jgi:hypothetical protein
MAVLILSLMLGCTSKIMVAAAPATATVYVTKQEYGAGSSLQTPPSTFVAKGEGTLSCTVDYFAWERFYVYADAAGYKSQVVPIPGEVKVGPGLVAFLCCLPVGMWAYGPTDEPINIALQKE